MHSCSTFNDTLVKLDKAKAEASEAHETLKKERDANKKVVGVLQEQLKKVRTVHEHAVGLLQQAVNKERAEAGKAQKTVDELQGKLTKMTAKMASAARDLTPE